MNARNPCECRLDGRQHVLTLCSALLAVPKPEPPRNPCSGDPCGPNAACREINLQRVCTCLPGFVGNPPACRPECVVHPECPPLLACLNNRCVDPCKGTCGINAECRVINHNPICSCLGGFTGDPFVRCTPSPIAQPTPPPVVRPPITPDTPRPTSPMPPIAGTPPPIKDQTIVPSAVDPQGTPPPIVDLPEPPAPPKDPCVPDPCGSNSYCRQNGDRYVCECREGYFGNPEIGCGPECVLSTDCASRLTCVRQKCVDPCPTACGNGAQCTVVNHRAVCSCPQGLQGDPYTQCVVSPIVGTTPSPTPMQPTAKTPCEPNPCGQNAECKPVGLDERCSCLPGFFGNPYDYCRPECTSDPECPSYLACVNQKCIDPCPGTCGINAECLVVTHAPMCYCRPGYVGDPYQSCRPEPVTTPSPLDPCNPSPCGPNSECRTVGDRPVCECLSGYFGSPPDCRPECIVNSNCPVIMACVNKKCRDPCAGACGTDALCEVVNHNPVCYCRQDMTGDPFIRCIESTSPKPHEPADPCASNPCGLNADCSFVGGLVVCKCQGDMIGNPYEACRHPCTVNSDCPSNKACSRNKCVDPCIGACGINAECHVSRHRPVCTCPHDLTGDPFSRCVLVTPTTSVPDDPCSPPPCGLNAECKRRGTASYDCKCIRDYFGDPYTECRPECVVNTDCPSDMACRNLKCIDPCPGTCGINAQCNTVNHKPGCACLPGFEGNANDRCQVQAVTPSAPTSDPCALDPCGPYSSCRVVRNRPVCECLPGYYGAPPNCHPECTTNPDCPKYLACVNEACVDPCVGTCGVSADCQVVNHNPTCTCPRGYVGDPYIQCRLVELTSKSPVPTSPTTISTPTVPTIATPARPCASEPCGLKALCKPLGEYFECTCPPGMFGNPYVECRYECVVDSDCARNRACERNKCIDPCEGVCGERAECHVIMHRPVCTCVPGFTGDAYTACNPVKVTTGLPPSLPQREEPCQQTTCGTLAECHEEDGRPVCHCIEGFVGDPYVACRPHCSADSHCASGLACVNDKCIDPCPGTCGINAECRVPNHVPICTCPPGYTGSAYQRCFPKPDTSSESGEDLCEVCGSNAECRIVDGRPVCTCLPGFLGAPPNCHPECIVNRDCSTTEACNKQKCVDPCIGACGTNADCRVINHSPVCTCLPGYTGEPFVRCNRIPVAQPTLAPPVTERPDPCREGTCGPNANCRVQGTRGICTCIEGYFGNPYVQCRPECVINSQCPQYLACNNQRCVDPCPGTCGIDAICEVVNHNPLCSCPRSMTGDPFVRCEPIRAPPDPCIPTPCGPYTKCQVVKDRAVCSCLPGYFGNPDLGCKTECTINSDCPLSSACINRKCVDPCIGVCGNQAKCSVVGHNPLCSCPDGFIGDPLTSCRLKPDVPVDPCNPNPCGINANCEVKNNRAFCTCFPGYFGNPDVECRPECIINSDCPRYLACANQKCIDPCPDSCGINALCDVINHNAMCSCPRGYNGDPYVECRVAPPPPVKCSPNACGFNTECRVTNGIPICYCLPSYTGDPYKERVSTSAASIPALPASLVLWGQSVLSSAIALCADVLQASREIRRFPALPSRLPPNQTVLLTVTAHWTKHAQGGNVTTLHAVESITDLCASVFQDLLPPIVEIQTLPTSVTRPPIAVTTITHSPIAEYPTTEHPRPKTPSPRPPFLPPLPSISVGCKSNDDCPYSNSCINKLCVDVCHQGYCGKNADCSIKFDIPMCSCPPGTSGDPFIRCKAVATEAPPTTLAPLADTHSPLQEAPLNPVVGSTSPMPPPLAAASTTRIPDTAFIQPTTIHSLPPPITIGCESNDECPYDNTCINKLCGDVCSPSLCGEDAECHTLSNRPSCFCPPGTTGNPTIKCTAILTERPSTLHPPIAETLPPPPAVPVQPISSPSHTPHPPIADVGTPRPLPLPFDEPEKPLPPIIPPIAIACENNDDCTIDNTCYNRLCYDVCVLGICGEEATCTITIHRPVCTCPPGTTGNPTDRCIALLTEKPTTFSPIAETNPPTKDEPIIPEALPGSTTMIPLVDPIHKRPTTPIPLPPEPPTPSPIVVGCESTDACPSDNSCINKLCLDVCFPGFCGENAECQTVQHRPKCKCPPGTSGNPTIKCSAIAVDVLPLPIAEPKPAPPHEQVIPIAGPTTTGLPPLAEHVTRPRPDITVTQPVPPPVGCKATTTERVTTHSPMTDRPPQQPVVPIQPIAGPSSELPIPVAEEPTTRPPELPLTTHRPVPTPPMIPIGCTTGNPTDHCVALGTDRPTTVIPLAERPIPPSDANIIPGIGPSSTPLPPLAETSIRPTEPPLPSTTPSPIVPPIVIAWTTGDPTRGCYAELTERPLSPPSPIPETRPPQDEAPIRPIAESSSPGLPPLAELPTPRPKPPPVTTPPPPPTPGTTGNPTIKCSAMVVDTPSTPYPPIAGEQPVQPDSPISPISGSSTTGQPPLAEDTIRTTPAPLPVRPTPQPIVPPISIACTTGNPTDHCVALGTDRPTTVIPLAERPIPPSDANIIPGIGPSSTPLPPLAETSIRPTEPPLPSTTPSPIVPPIVIACENNDDCTTDNSCINNLCYDVCSLGICGDDADCRIRDHRPVCSCPPGTTGDPTRGCYAELTERPLSPPSPIPETRPPQDEAPNKTHCRIIKPGLPPLAELPTPRPKPPPVTTPPPPPTPGPIPVGCETTDDCPSDNSCVNRLCLDVCYPGICGNNAECQTHGHRPLCTCPPGTTGNPTIKCSAMVVDTPSTPYPPIAGEQPVQPDSPISPISGSSTTGQPPLAEDTIRTTPAPLPVRPTPQPIVPPISIACENNDDCDIGDSCINMLCYDACSLNFCGEDADCKTIDHRPVCVCPPGTRGDPQIGFVATVTEKVTTIPPVTDRPPQQPVVPIQPIAGPSSELPIPVAEEPTTRPPELPLTTYRPVPTPPMIPIGCESTDDCPFDNSCVNRLCMDVCHPGLCGENADCQTVGHKPSCLCPPGTTGNPTDHCVALGTDRPTTVIPLAERPIPPSDANIIPGIGPSSTPLPPLAETSIRPTEPPLPSTTPSPIVPPIVIACENNDDCTTDNSCINNLCYDVCSLGICGDDADCRIRDHRPVCSCPPGTTGDPTRGCYAELTERPLSPPSPIPETRPPQDEAPIRPIAESSSTGLPPLAELLTPRPKPPPVTTPPPPPTPGPIPVGCETTDDCPSDNSCVNRLCLDVCYPGICGNNAECQTHGHRPLCTCPPGTTGNPTIKCSAMVVDTPSTPYPPIAGEQPVQPDSPISPISGSSTTGQPPLAEDTIRTTPAPLPVRPTPQPIVPPISIACENNDDCDIGDSCINMLCYDACSLNFCGEDADCKTIDHRPVCVCPPGTRGDPQIGCVATVTEKVTTIPPVTDRPPQQPVVPIQPIAGPSSELPIPVAEEPTTRPPELPLTTYRPVPTPPMIPIGCESTDDCPFDNSCVNRLCMDVCHPGLCGENADCQTVGHKPSCVCPPGTTGNPTKHCLALVTDRPTTVIPLGERPQPPADVNIIPGIGPSSTPLPPLAETSIRPTEPPLPSTTPSPIVPPIVIACENNDDCTTDNSCINNLCYDVCSLGICGDDADCRIHDHRPVCSCPPGTTGDPTRGCYAELTERPLSPPSPIPETRPPQDEAPIRPIAESSSPGLPPLAELPTPRPKPLPVTTPPPPPTPGPIPVGCETTDECPSDNSCINRLCLNVCYPGICGSNAECQTHGHRPLCTCPPGTTGNPTIKCSAVAFDIPTTPYPPVAGEQPVQPDSPISPISGSSTTGQPPLAEDTIRTTPAPLPVRPIPQPVIPPISIACENNDDCDIGDSCINMLCYDACSLNFCGEDADCKTIDHRPVCVCPPGTSGNPQIGCVGTVTEKVTTIPPVTDRPPQQPVVPIQPIAGPSSELPIPVAEEPTTRPPELPLTTYRPVPTPPMIPIGCESTDDCPFDNSCVNRLCMDVCHPGLCGENADCQTVGHKPSCVCPPGTTGNPTDHCVALVTDRPTTVIPLAERPLPPSDANIIPGIGPSSTPLPPLAETSIRPIEPPLPSTTPSPIVPPIEPQEIQLEDVMLCSLKGLHLLSLLYQRFDHQRMRFP
ncbi:hypothetical protein C7M84_020737 [Penaeus vannamei]|uniref:EGF-like domain-containing protein n=1 Tax=Penaeus vannamei TaxID=6689 RepID=A0A3R7LQ73_PENVA|nr:hypothetical protein C7M84_020737 [Penaeus vannamei]